MRSSQSATAGQLTEEDGLRLAAGVERDSEHTIAQGIVRTAEERGLPVPASDGFETIPGHGVRATVEGRTLHMGGPAMLRPRWPTRSLRSSRLPGWRPRS